MINPRHTLDSPKQNSAIKLLTSAGSGVWGSGIIGTVNAPIIFYAGPSAGQIWSVTRVFVYMHHGTTRTADLGYFWRNGAALTNGILFRKTRNGVLDHYIVTDPIKTAMEMMMSFTQVKSDMYITPPHTTNEIMIDFYWRSEDAGYELWLDGDKGERIEWVIQDTMPNVPSWVIRAQYEVIKG